MALSSAFENCQIPLQFAVDYHANHQVISQFDQGGSHLFRVPSSVHCRQCNLCERICHGFLATKKPIGMVVGRRRGYLIH